MVLPRSLTKLRIGCLTARMDGALAFSSTGGLIDLDINCGRFVTSGGCSRSGGIWLAYRNLRHRLKNIAQALAPGATFYRGAVCLTGPWP